MNWNETSGYYLTRLPQINKLARYANNLAVFAEVNCQNEDRKLLRKNKNILEKQLKRLQEGEFRIAVVGLEKAGKSTFINAWLERELLPVDDKRCTFTTTKIYSVTDRNKQRIEVTVRSEDEFEKLIQQLKNDDRDDDLKLIEKNEDTLRKIRELGNQKIPFQQIDEKFKEDIKKYVADEKFAHSVLEVKIYICNEINLEGIVLHDVPGINSGLQMHLDETKKILSDCDAVVVLQVNPSLVDNEKNILREIGAGDPNIKIEEKTFVFLNKIDMCGTQEILQARKQEAIKEWQNLANLSEKRITFGSAFFYLSLEGISEVSKDGETQEQIKTNQLEKLRILTEYNDKEDLISKATGIPLIQGKLKTYLNKERAETLKKRCNESIKKIVEISRRICDLVPEEYLQPIEEFKAQQEKNLKSNFAGYFGETLFPSIIEDLQTYIDDANNNRAIEIFRAKYQDIIKGKIDEFQKTILKNKNKSFAEATNMEVFAKDQANVFWRKEIYLEVTKLLTSLSKELAISLKDESFKLINKMSELLWNSEDIKTQIFNNLEQGIKSENDYKNKLEISFGVLFLRFVRPLAEMLIAAPVGSDRRKGIIKKYSNNNDIELLDQYLSMEQKNAFEILKKYLNHGYKLLVDRQLRKDKLDKEDPIDNYIKYLDKISLIDINKVLRERNIPQLPPEAQIPEDEQQIDLIKRKIEKIKQEIEDKNDVIKEVLYDVYVFEKYLTSVIFEAAGFELFYKDELGQIENVFKSSKLRAIWQDVATRLWQEGNLSLLEDDRIPNEFKISENHGNYGEIAKAVTNLSKCLKEVKEETDTVYESLI